MMSNRSHTVTALSVSIMLLTAPLWSASSGDELDHLGIEPLQTSENATPARPHIEQRSLVRATLILAEGDTTAGVSGPVTALNQPFVNGFGDPGFTGIADEGFVWSDNGIRWVNSDGLPSLLTGVEFTMGIGNLGTFIYSTSTDGADSVWTDAGLLAVENVQAPGMPAGINSTFHSRPTMIPSGQAFWVAGHNDGTTSTSTVGRIFYTSPDGTASGAAVVLKTGDVIDGQIIDTNGIDFDYDVSDSSAHHIHILDMEGSTDADGFIYVDGALVARELNPTGAGDNWDNFDFVSINDSGDFLFTGDTDGDTSSDEFIAFNGSITLREGDVVDGVTLEPGWAVRGAGINNLGQAVFGWGTTDNEHLFFSCDASDLGGTSRRILSIGDDLDFDGDGLIDATVTDLPTGLVHNFQLADDGRFFILAGVILGALETDAVIGLNVDLCPLFADGFENGDTGAWNTTTP